MKIIFVVGGVVSGVGKGISTASIGMLLTMRGHKVSALKLDGYLNVNAGVLAPREHGEVWVCDDGSETDLDLGTYERFLNTEVSGKNIITNGSLYKELIEEQEEGKYLGETIQIVTHLVPKIKNKILDLANQTDILIAEIGGSIGDSEISAYLETIRQIKQEYRGDVLVVLVAPILWIPTIKEFKTKPLQQSVKELQSFGLQPEILLCRIDRPIPNKILDKVANLTNVPREAVFDAPDVSTVYQVPIEFYNRHLDDLIADKFHLKRNGCRIHKYRELVEKYVNGAEQSEVTIAVVGKYDNPEESYLSLKEALYHAGVVTNVKVKITWIAAEELENKRVGKYFEDVNGLIIPGGFGERGVSGKLKAIKYARDKKIPFLGICLGLQCAVIEISRNFCGIATANSIEFDTNTPEPVVHFVPGQENIRKKSGTMRLGAFDCEIVKDSLAWELYKKKIVSERHRHRYEVNAEYLSVLEDKGFVVSGKNPETGLVEIMELKKEIHPFFIGTQFHGEYKSRLGSPHPLFVGLLEASLLNKAPITQPESL
jgi:CTP synthase